MDYPQEILDKLNNAAQRTNQPLDTMKQFYETEFNEISKLDDSQFQDPLERHRYCIQLFWVKYVTRPPVKPHNIIPLGYSKPRTSKAKGSTSARMYVIDATDGKLHPLVVYEEQFGVIESITLNALYQNVNLGEYNDGITFTADNRAVFGTPDMVEASPTELISRYSFPLITIKDIEKNLSKKITSSTGSFTDELDWKCIRGMIKRVNMSKDKTRKIGYNVSDLSVVGEPQRILPDGTRREPGLTIWMDEKLMSADQYDECFFYGPVDKREPSEEDAKDPKKAPPEPAMNAFVMFKVHGK